MKLLISGIDFHLIFANVTGGDIQNSISYLQGDEILPLFSFYASKI
jgi:hypothetical protein